MSRPFLIRLLDAGEMPFSLVGRHRRIRVSDLIDYAKRKSERKAALEKLARDADAPGCASPSPPLFSSLADRPP
jgi:excisionase family DNA binding protein